MLLKIPKASKEYEKKIHLERNFSVAFTADYMKEIGNAKT